MSKKITDNKFIYYFQENCTESLALQIDYSFKEIGFISIFKSAYIKHKGKIPTDKLLKVCPIFEPKDAVEFHDFICKFCVIKRGFFVQEKFDKIVDEIMMKSEKSKKSAELKWAKEKALRDKLNSDANAPSNAPANGDAKVKDKVKDKDIIINNNIEKDKKEMEIPNFIDSELWNDFLKMRIIAKAKPTKRAIELLLKDLDKFENNSIGGANKSLEQSIKNNWRGVFESKNNNKSRLGF